MKRLLLIIGLVTVGIAGNVYADDVPESIRHELGLDRCHEEQVRSAAPDPIINDETCKRTICEGNFWGSSCTDVCCNGDERTVGEGEEQVRYEICYMRRCSRTDADDAWIETPRQTDRLPSEPHSDNSTFDQGEGRYSQNLWDILIKDAMADVTLGEPDEFFTFLSSYEKILIVNELNYALENMRRARDEWGPSSEYNIVGRDASELRSYFFLTFKLLLEARKVLMPELYCDIRYDTYCFSGVTVGWGEHYEAGVGEAFGAARGIRIQLATEYRLNANPNMAKPASIVFIHELTHSFACYQGWFLRCDQNGNLLPLESGGEWKYFHNESTAYIIESIYAYFLLLDNRGGRTGDAENEIFTSPTGAYAAYFESLEELASTFHYLQDNRGALARRVCAAIESLALSFYSTNNPIFHDWFEEQLSRPGVSNYDLGVSLLHHFNLSPTVIFDIWENQFQAAGGIFRLWPACSEYIHGSPTGQVEEGYEECLGLSSDTHPDLAHDTMASPDTGQGEAENVDGEPPDEEEYASWDEPEDPSRVSSSEEEEVAESEGAESPVMPMECLGGDLSGTSLANCAEYCSRSNRLRNPICAGILSNNCRQLDNPSLIITPECISLCSINPGLDFCPRICGSYPIRGSFCGDICTGVTSGSYPPFCRILCQDHFSVMQGWGMQNTCRTMCNSVPRGPYCTTRYCEESPRPTWCPPEDTGAESGSSGSDGGSGGDDGRAGESEGEIEDEESEEGSRGGGGRSGCSAGWEYPDGYYVLDQIDDDRRCYPYVGNVRCCRGRCEPNGSNHACVGTHHGSGEYCGCDLTGELTEYYCTNPVTGVWYSHRCLWCDGMCMCADHRYDFDNYYPCACNYYGTDVIEAYNAERCANW